MELKILSYNSTGLSDQTVAFIKELLDKENPDILLLQETWRIKSTMDKLGCIHSDYLPHGVPGTDEEKELLCGRPSGGVAILYKKSLSSAISRVKPEREHKRLCGVIMKCGDYDLLIMNVYMPNDTYSHTHVKDEFMDVCDQIECMIHCSKPTFCVIGGDMNVDFRRENAHANYFCDFIQRNDFINTWNLPHVIPTDTFVNYDGGAKSRIDYIMCSVNMEYSVHSLNALVLHDNKSWHRPLVMCIDMDDNIAPLRETPGDTNTNHSSKRIAWHRVTDLHVDQYQKKLDKLLQSKSLPSVVYCQDLLCNNQEHQEQISVWCEFLSDCCVTAGDETLPKCRRRGLMKPKWTEDVKPLKDVSLMWHNIWVDEGEPEEGEVYEMMRQAKRDYFYAARQACRREKHTRYEQMAKAAAGNKSRDFWNEVKRMNSSKVIPPHVDSQRNENDIAEVFKGKYKNLLNQVPSSPENISDIQKYIDKNVVDAHPKDYVITEEDVKDAVNLLKSGKSDGSKGVMSDHIKYAPPRLLTLISLLLTVAQKHGHMPEELIQSTLASIPKDKCGDICDSDNYRGIALSSCIAKIHDIIILKRYKRQLATSEMQYAFKEKHGTSMCTLALKEVSRYYHRNNSDVYIAQVDASKAFDRVRHDMLFKLLIDRGMPPVILRCLFDSYRRQSLRATWNGAMSENFTTMNGIKQGSVISPVLFTVYMDELLLRLENSGYGCYIGGHYYGAISSADDLSLMCPTLHGLQKMIHVCEEYGSAYGVKYNPKKSVAMSIPAKKSEPLRLPALKIGGDNIAWVKTAKHLGNYFSCDFKETEEIVHKRGDLIGRVNNMCSSFSNAPDGVKSQIFNSRCSHLYGCEAWDFTDPLVDKFRTTWNRGVRKIYNLPYCTHTRLLELFIDRPYVLDQMYKRFYKMVLTMSNSDNVRLSYLSRRMINDSCSIIGKNLQMICARYGFNYYNRTCLSLHDFKYKDYCDDDVRIFHMIQELRDTLRGSLHLNLSKDEINDIIYSLCCD